LLAVGTAPASGGDGAVDMDAGEAWIACSELGAAGGLRFLTCGSSISADRLGPGSAGFTTVTGTGDA
jgi:hypothetical protein